MSVFLRTLEVSVVMNGSFLCAAVLGVGLLFVPGSARAHHGDAGSRFTMTGRRLKSGAPYMNLTGRANIALADTGTAIFRAANFGQPGPSQQK